MAVFKPPIPEPGHKTPATTEIPRESARDAQAALCDGFINVEGNTAVEFAQWPIEKEEFVWRRRKPRHRKSRLGTLRTAWRNKQTGKFVKKPSSKQMDKWTQVQPHHGRITFT